MVKTLASIAVILVSLGMAWGIKSVADKNKAATQVAPSGLNLEITSPSDSVVRSPNIIISGKTAVNAEVLVDSMELTADANGEFTTQLTLDAGENKIVITANNEDGEYNEKTLMVVYEPTE